MTPRTTTSTRTWPTNAIARIRMLTSVAPDKPWLQYYATGTAHAPHHAPKEWIDKFKGKFDQGWDKQREETFARQKEMGIIPKDAKFTERSAGIPAWDSCNADQKRVFARMMEVYAGALAHADHQMGRILDAIEELGELDNTLVIYIQGDNGASAEGSPQGLLNEMTFFNAVPEDFAEVLARVDELGGPMTYNHYPIGWAHAMNTPFQWTKQVASHFGGTRNGLVISWPARIKDKGGIRAQFHHVIDIAPTILEACGVRVARRAERRAAKAGRGREHALHVRRREGALATPHAVLRDARQPRHLRRWLGGVHDAAARAVGQRRASRSIWMTTSGSSTTSRKTSARP